MKKTSTRGRGGRPSAAVVEWVGGNVRMPAYVTGEGEPYRPEALFWMDADGAVVGMHMGKPGSVLPTAGESLQRSIEQPMHGRPSAPTRVRVASRDLAATLRASHSELDIVCAPTPELDAMLRIMQETMDEGGQAEQSYLSPAIGPDAVASFFGATAALFRAAPWRIVPDGETLFAVTVEQLGLRNAALSVIGQLGESLGLVLFSSIDDFEAYIATAELFDADGEPTVPAHLTLNFERGADLPVPLRKEVARHGWDVAGADAYPWLLAIDEDLIARPPTAGELRLFEAVAHALTDVLDEKKELRAAWSGGEPLSRTLCVPTHLGEIEVTLRTPYKATPASPARPADSPASKSRAKRARRKKG